MYETNHAILCREKYFEHITHVVSSEISIVAINLVQMIMLPRFLGDFFLTTLYTFEFIISCFGLKKQKSQTRFVTPTRYFPRNNISFI